MKKNENVYFQPNNRFEFIHMDLALLTETKFGWSKYRITTDNNNYSKRY